MSRTEKTQGCCGALSWHEIAQHVKRKGHVRQEELSELVVTQPPKATWTDAMQVLATRDARAWQRYLRQLARRKTLWRLKRR